MAENGVNDREKRECQAEVGRLLGVNDHSSSPARVVVLLDAIRVLEKKYGMQCLSGIYCVQCKGTNAEYRKAYYDPQRRRVLICCDNRSSSNDLRKTMIHELVHVYDHCRYYGRMKDSFFTACSEVRASYLGECSDLMKWKRKQCAVKQAIASVASSTGRSRVDAAELVNKVAEKCLKDKSPFTQ
eukprot:Nk52_evm28s352 gene=Nk52_evmTU28s352